MTSDLLHKPTMNCMESPAVRVVVGSEQM